MTNPSPLIVLTTDFSAESGRAYTPTVELCRKLDGRILLLHVVEATAITPHGAPLAPVQLPPDTSAMVHAAKTRMAEEVQKLGTSVHVQPLVVDGIDVARTVAEVARDKGASFIATSTHGRSGLRRLVLGSVAEALIRHASVPVICFPIAH